MRALEAQGCSIAPYLMLRAQLHAGVVQAQCQDACQETLQPSILRDVTLWGKGQGRRRESQTQKAQSNSLQ
jgi:hypothetical protein